jgi:hypothetical protein
MERLTGKVIFSIGKIDYRWEDVLRAAQYWSEWSRLATGVRYGMACQHKAQKENGLDPDEVEQAAADFRYSRDLIAAEEMETWLAERGLTAEEWMGSIERGLLLQKYPEDLLQEIIAEFPVDEKDAEKQILIEGLCSGTFAQVSKRLAGRAAIVDAMRSESEETAHLEVAEMEGFFEKFRSQIITPGAIEQTVQNHAMDWIQFEIQCVSFPEESMIREAMLCIKEDGISIREIATQTKALFWEKRVYLEDLDSDMRDHFVGAQKGELLGPFKTQEKFVLTFVAEKTIPKVRDETIRTRAADDLVRRSVEHEINNRVKWHFAI